MRPEQERVRNLLIDTVTLLCKNSVQFTDVLHVEGLLGVSVDKKDVFFVHISKEFTISPSEGATVTQDTSDSRDADSRQDEPTELHDTTDSNKRDRITVKTERLEAEEECLIVEDPSIKLEGSVSPAQIIAGQRRATKRTSQSGGHYDGSSSFQGGTYGMDSGSSNSGYGPTGEPYVKRQLVGATDDYRDQDQDQDEGTYTGQDGNNDESGGGGGGQGWPSLAAISGSFDTNQQSFQQDSDNSQMSLTDGTQPGCSSWSAGPSDSMFVAHPVTTGRAGNTGWHPRPLKLLPKYEKLSPPIYEKKPTHECELCAKVFPDSQALVNHLRTHVGDHPLACPFCDLRFLLKTHLKEHLQTTHTNLLLTQQDTEHIAQQRTLASRDATQSGGNALTKL